MVEAIIPDVLYLWASATHATTSHCPPVLAPWPCGWPRAVTNCGLYPSAVGNEMGQVPFHRPQATRMGGSLFDWYPPVYPVSPR